MVNRLEIRQMGRWVWVTHATSQGEHILYSTKWGKKEPHFDLQLARQDVLRKAYELSLQGYGEVKIRPEDRRYTDRFVELDVLQTDVDRNRIKTDRAWGMLK